MIKKKNTPVWYIELVLILFLIVYIVDILDPLTQWGTNLLFANIITIIAFLYMIFNLVFIIKNYNVIEKNGILLAFFAFISLLVPLIVAFTPYEPGRDLQGYLLYYTLPIITVIYASYLLIKNKRSKKVRHAALQTNIKRKLVK